MKTVAAPSEAFEVQLGLDLWELIDALGVPVVEVREVTTIPPSDGLRGSFHVTLADGQTLKARRLRTPGDVERVTRLSSLLDPQFFPPIVAHRGCGLLTRWIPGVSIRSDHWTATDLRTCGRVHAAMHRLPVPREVEQLRRSPMRSEQRLEQLLDELVERRDRVPVVADLLRSEGLGVVAQRLGDHDSADPAARDREDLRGDVAQGPTPGTPP